MVDSHFLANSIQNGTIKTKYTKIINSGQVIWGRKKLEFSSEFKFLELSAKMAKVTKSPKLAAMGVATLSGSMFKCLEAIMTPIIITPRQKLAIDAVKMLDVDNNKAWVKSNLSWGSQPTNKAKIDAKPPTTTPWICISAKLDIAIREDQF